MIQAMVCSLVPMSGAGTSFSRSDELDEFGGVAAGHALELILRHLFRDRR